MYVHERHPHICYVDLVAFTSTNNDSTSLRDALLFTGYGILQDSNRDTEVLSQSFRNNEIKLIKNTDGWKENETFEIRVSHIIDPDNIYVQKVSNVCVFIVYTTVFSL